jgi:ATP-binding cassette, subfamily B, bacterial
MEEVKDLKNFLSVARWMVGQARPLLISIIIITITGTALSLCGVSIAVASKKIIDLSYSGDKNKALLAAVFFGVIVIIMIGLRAVVSVLRARTGEVMSNNIRSALFQRILGSQWLEASKYHSEDILTRMTSDISALSSGLVNLVPEMISLGVGLIAAFVTLFAFDPRLAVSAFILSPVSIILSRVFGRKLKLLYVKMQEAESTSRSFIHETLQNILIVKAFCLEESSTLRVNKLQNDKLGWVMRRSRMVCGTNSVLLLGYWLGYFLAFGWGAFRLSNSSITFGTLAAFLQLVEQIQGPFIGLAYSIPQLISAFASAGRLMELEKMQADNTVCRLPSWESAGIRFEGVSFAYGTEKTVLNNVHADIQPGEIIGIVGTSGKGKTTLIRLLLSLVSPAKGRVYFTDGKGKKLEACSSTRAFISYVPQGNTLFSGTIAENLRIGYSEANDDELETAARAACAWEFIEALPEGLDTVIGERGLGLSEGQAQRIAIARALLRKAPIIIFDEATSALDADTELEILNTIRDLNPLRTCIIITHRKAALHICSRVLKLEEGQIQEQYVKTTEASAIQAV